MKKINTERVNDEILISKKAFNDILSRFNKITFDEQLTSFKNSKALKSILESDKNGNLDKKKKFVEKIFGKAKNDNKGSFAAQSAILTDFFYLAIVNNNLDKKYESFMNRLNNRITKRDPKLYKATEYDLIAAVNKVYSL